MFSNPNRRYGDGPIARNLAVAQRQRVDQLKQRLSNSALNTFDSEAVSAEVGHLLAKCSANILKSSTLHRELVLDLAAQSGLYPDSQSLAPGTTTAERIRQTQVLNQIDALLRDASNALDLTIETIASLLKLTLPGQNNTGEVPLLAQNFDIAASDMIPQPAMHVLKMIELISSACAQAERRGYTLFSSLLSKIERSTKEVSGLDPNAAWPSSKNWRAELRKQLGKPLTATQLVDMYLYDTPLRRIFEGSTRLTVRVDERIEHMHLLAPSGAGKTRTLEFLVTQDLPSVSCGKASVLVMESEGKLIDRLAQHAFRNPTHPNSIDGRVTLIDPGRIGAMPTFNLFGVVSKGLKTAPQIEREMISNSVTDLYRYVFRALRGGEMTERQGYIFNKLIQMLIWVDGATFGTLMECLRNTDKTSQIALSAPKPLQEFFTSEYPLRTYHPTRTELYQRLDTFLSSAETLNRMLSGTRSNYDLSKDLNEGRLILINTNKEILGEEGSAVFGRFIIALIRLLSFKRNDASKPLFLYLDEAYEYIDEKVTALFRQGRKRRIGIVAAHQELAQLDMISSDTRHAIQTNTQIKMAGNCDYRDRVEMARNMGNTSQEFFTTLRKQQRVSTEFALFVRNLTPAGAVRVRIPLGTLESLGFVKAPPPLLWPTNTNAAAQPDETAPSDSREKRQKGEWIDPWS